MVITTTISSEIWQLLEEEEQLTLKELNQRLASDFGFNFEYEYFWIKWTKESWLQASLTAPHIVKYLRIQP